MTLEIHIDALAPGAYGWNTAGVGPVLLMKDWR